SEPPTASRTIDIPQQTRNITATSGKMPGSQASSRQRSPSERITVRYHLSGMPAAGTAACLRHHLSLAGRADPLFSDDALAAVHDASRGKPREINNLARNALLAGYTERKNIIGHACIRAAITEASTDHKTP
ncbi:MAG: hypothetical protein ACRDPY_38285, partial [Streptosporangiaceae bacterium]